MAILRPSDSLMRDVIVVVPGMTGSTLAKNGRMVWALTPGAIVDGIRTFGRSVKSLALPGGIGDEHPEDGVEPVSVMPDLHALPGNLVRTHRVRPLDTDVA